MVKDRAEAKEYVLKLAKEHDVKFIRLWFTDILGFLKSFAITKDSITGTGFIISIVMSRAAEIVAGATGAKIVYTPAKGRRQICF